MNKGRLIVIEGPDDSGKSTLAAGLYEHMKSAGIESEVLSFPGHGIRKLGSLTYELHAKAVNDTNMVTPTALQAAHVASHIDLIESRILPSLRKGCAVVLDRYWWSTWVYGRLLDADPGVIDQLIDAERLAWEDTTPEVIFLLKGRRPMGRLEELYEELAVLEEGRRRVVRMEAEASPEATCRKAVAHVAMP